MLTQQPTAPEKDLAKPLLAAKEVKVEAKKEIEEEPFIGPPRKRIKITNDKNEEIEFDVTSAMIFHLSSQGTEEEKLSRIEGDPRLQPGVVVGGDFNFRLDSIRGINYWNSFLANHGLAMSSDDTIDSFLAAVQDALSKKRVLDPSINSQVFTKIALDAGAKDGIFVTEQIQSLSQDELLVSGVNLLRFKNSPMNLDLLKLTRGIPTYGIYTDPITQENSFIYVAPSGLPQIIKVTDQNNLQRLIGSFLPANVEFPQDAEVVGGTATAETVATVRECMNNHVPHKGSYSPKYLARMKQLGKRVDDFIKKVEGMPISQRTIENIRKLAEEQYAEDLVNYDKSETTEVKAYNDAFEQIIKISQGANQCDHRLKKVYNPATNTMSYTYNMMRPEVMPENHFKPSAKPKAETEENRPDLKIPLTQENSLEYTTVYTSYEDRLLIEGTKLLLLREARKIKEHKNIEDYETLVRLAGEDPSIREKIANSYRAILDAHKTFKKLPKEDKDKLVTDFTSLLDREPALYKDTVTHQTSVAGPCKILTHHDALLDVCQKALIDNTKFDSLTEKDLETYFTNVVNSEEYRRINGDGEESKPEFAGILNDRFEKPLQNLLKLIGEFSLKYDLAPMSVKKLEKAKKGKNDILEIECDEEKLSYRVIGQNGKDTVTGVIPRNILGDDFPKTTQDVLDNSKKFLPRILAQTAKAHHTANNMDQEWRRRFDKALICMLSKQDLSEPDAPGKTFAPMTGGFVPPKGPGPKGAFYTMKQVVDDQLDGLFANLYHDLLLKLDKKTEFQIGCPEMKFQPEKLAAIRKVFDIVNNFNNLIAEPTVEQTRAFYNLMREFDKKYAPAIYNIGLTAQVRKDEAVQLSSARHKLRAAGINAGVDMDPQAESREQEVPSSVTVTPSIALPAPGTVKAVLARLQKTPQPEPAQAKESPKEPAVIKVPVSSNPSPSHVGKFKQTSPQAESPKLQDKGAKKAPTPPPVTLSRSLT